MTFWKKIKIFCQGKTRRPFSSKSCKMTSGKRKKKTKNKRNSPCGCTNSCCFATEDQLKLHWTWEGPLQCGGLSLVHSSKCASCLKAPQLSGLLDLHHSTLLLHWRSVSISLLDLHNDPLEDLHSGLGWRSFHWLIKKRFYQQGETNDTSILTSFSFAEDSMNAAPQESASFFPSSGWMTLKKNNQSLMNAG